MKKLLLVIILISAGNLYGQVDSTKSPLAYLKVDFLNAINPADPSFLASAELFPIGSAFSTFHEFGFVTRLYDNTNSEDGEAAHVPIVSSFKTRHGIRYHGQFSDSFIGFVGLYYQFRKITVEETYIMGFECETGDCTYYRNVNGQFETHRSAFIWDMGVQYFIHPRIVMEGSVGGGISQFSVAKMPFEDAVFVERNRFIQPSKFEPQLYLIFGAKLGFVLFK